MIEKILDLRAAQAILNAPLPLREGGRVFRAFPVKGAAFLRILGQAGG